MAPTWYTLNGETFTKFIVVYIDGNSLIAQDALIRRGIEGGIEAAQNLRSYVVECLCQKQVSMTRGLGIIIYVYADAEILATNYREPNSPKGVELPQARKRVREFCQGFSSAHPWSCFDDVSVSPSRKYQLRGSFLQQLLSDDCILVAFVRPTNVGFQALIDAQRKTLLTSKITTLPLPSAFFRPVKNVGSGEPMQLQVNSPPREVFQTSKKSAMLGIFQKESTPTMRYPGKIYHTGTWGEASQQSIKTKNSVFTIPQNSAGQRIDPPIDASEELVNTVKHKKACKNAHLLGHCLIFKCKFSHEVLTEQELDALRQHARQWPCRNESWCLDPSCYWGHMCPRGSSCDWSRCRFQKSEHVDDFQVNHYALQYLYKKGGKDEEALSQDW